MSDEDIETTKIINAWLNDEFPAYKWVIHHNSIISSIRGIALTVIVDGLNVALYAKTPLANTKLCAVQLMDPKSTDKLKEFVSHINNLIKKLENNILRCLE